LEKELAAFFGTESALVFPDGYLAPLAVAQALAGEFSHAFIDELAHAALVDAARMLHCPVKTFAHRNVTDLARRLSKFGKRSRPILLTDGMFSHDGSVAPLAEYLKILPHPAIILVDDAHGVGVLGARGRGALEHAGVSRTRIIQCATLSKAFGAYGGVALGARKLREKIITRSRLFAGSTPLPPPLAGAALAGLAILKREPARRKKLFRNVSYLRSQLRQSGWEIAETPGPIVRLPFLNAAGAENLKKRLLAAGIYPPFVKYGKASAAGFFRFIISSEHSERQLDKLAAALNAFKSKSR
jgi:7-keto-8-aminopelargonate synthetase-like enzyme